MSNPGPGPVPSRFISTILTKSADYTVTAADVFGGNVIILMDATAGQKTVTMNPNLGTIEATPNVLVLKTDATTNPVVINNGTIDIDAIVAPATAAGQIGGWRNLSSNGTVLSSNGSG
jgi:hypothetical protein